MGPSHPASHSLVLWCPPASPVLALLLLTVTAVDCCVFYYMSLNFELTDEWQISAEVASLAAKFHSFAIPVDDPIKL